MDYQLFLTLLAGHYLADFALQTPFMAEAKRQVFTKSIGFHALTAHAFIHALIAGLLSGSLAVAVIVGVTHWIIDLRASKPLVKKLNKDTELFGINTDQALHIAVMFVIVLLVV